MISIHKKWQTSPVWEYFRRQELEDSKITCNICPGSMTVELQTYRTKHMDKPRNVLVKLMPSSRC